MKINAEKTANKLLITMEGRLDTTTAPEMEKVINDQIQGVTELILDLKALKYMSSAGLRVLLSSQKKMKAVQGTMTVKNVNALIMEVFEATGFADILTIDNGG